LETCKQHDLSPFKKEIYLLKTGGKNGDKYHTIVGIDGVRTKAARTGQYAGKTDVRYNLRSDGTYQTAAELKAIKAIPITATITVKRVVCGVIAEFTHTAVFAEFYPNVADGKSDFSKAAQMPFQMIAKVAESFALKQGFSDQLSGLHIEEEAAAFEDVTIKAATDEKIDPEIQAGIDQCADISELEAYYRSLSLAQVKITPAISKQFTARKNEIS
jgi:phage recombination protein Bet